MYDQVLNDLVNRAQENDIVLHYRRFNEQVPEWPEWGYHFSPNWTDNWFVWATMLKGECFQVIIHYGNRTVDCALAIPPSDGASPFVTPANLRRHTVLRRGNAHVSSSLGMAMNYMRNLPRWRRYHLFGPTREVLS